MAVFQWVGGYTDWRGFGSGYSGNFKGSGKEVWTSVWNGMTSQKGDFAFAPYHWAFLQNWRERVPATPPLSQYSPFDLISATRLPRGGDSVVFGFKWNSSAGPLFSQGAFDMFRANLGISCLFGGCSGSSSNSLWTAASSGASGDIDFIVTDDFGWGYVAQNTFPSGLIAEGQTPVGYSRHLAGFLTFYPDSAPAIPFNTRGYTGLAIGQIGFDSSQITGNPQVGFTAKEFTVSGEGLVRTENYIAPLHLRFSNFAHKARKAKCRIRQISSSTTGTASIDGWENLLRSTNPVNNSNSPIAGETGNDSLLMLAGYVDTVLQDQGYLSSLTYNGSNLVADTITIRENIGGAFISEASNVTTAVTCEPKSVRTTIAIHCGVPDLTTKHDTNQRQGYPGYEGTVNRVNTCNYFIGNRTDGNDGNGFSYTNWTVQPLGATTTDKTGIQTPRINMFHLSCDNLTALGGFFKPTNFTTDNTYFIFRDGSINGDAYIDLNRGNDTNYRNGLIGSSPSDEGLRQDSDDARVIFNLGDNIRTKGWEFPA